jgi:hypothetical protein
MATRGECCEKDRIGDIRKENNNKKENEAKKRSQGK